MLYLGMLPKTIKALLLLAASVAFAACGGSSEKGEPLLSGSVTGTYGEDSFTAVNGFAYEPSDTSKIIGLGDGPLNCNSPYKTDPPSGMMGGINLPSFEVGTYNGVMVTVYTNKGGFEGKGTNAGSVEITASSAESIAGTVAYNDEYEGTTLALNGGFEVVHCPQ
jgi:hypothetical protein